MAAHLGMTVRELLERIDSRELSEWAAYEQVEGPLGGPREDVLAAIIASTVHNTAQSKKGKRVTPKDYLPQWDNRKSQTWQEQLAAVRAINSVLDGKEGGRGGDAGGIARPHRRGQ